MNNQNLTSLKEQSVSTLNRYRKTLAYHMTGFIVRSLSRTKISPNMISWAGFVITLGAAALIITGHLFAAGFVVIFAGFFDMLDGALARATDKITKFGGVLDSTLDRLSESALLLGVLVVYAAGNSIPGVVLVGLALIGSLMVSYVRSRAEAAGLKGEAGIFTRPERVIVLTLGLLLSSINYALTTALIIIVVFSFITVFQRMLSVHRQLKNSDGS